MSPRKAAEQSFLYKLKGGRSTTLSRLQYNLSNGNRQEETEV